MASIQIPNLPAVTSLSGSEQMEAVQGGVSSRVTINQISAFAGSQYGLTPIASGELLGNISGVSAIPVGNALTAYMDNAFGTTQGAIVYRGSTNWQSLNPGVLGQALTTNGPNANPQYRDFSGGGTVLQITAGTNLAATPVNPITSSGTISTVMDPAFTTSVTTPILYGGTTASSSLTLQSTSGSGTSDNIIFKTGSGTTAMTIGTAQNVNIGTGAVLSTATLRLNKNITGGTTAYGMLSQGTVQSDVTANAYGNIAQLNTAAASFTLTGLQHFTAAQGTIGLGSQVTNQYGFNAGSNLIGATNNYGFYSATPSVTTATISNVSADGATATITTSAAHGYGKGQSVIVAATTNTSLNGTFTITSVASTTTFTYAIAATVASQADTGSTYVNTGRFNFYGAGTAPNLFNGSLQVGSASNTGGVALSSTQPAHFKAGASGTYTDIVSSGTVSNAFSSLFVPGTFAARLATTYTTAATVYISAAPTAGTNVTFGIAYALYSAAGANYFGGAVVSNTSTTTPIIYGGTGAASSLTLQSTSGAGTTDSILMKVGNAGATTALSIATTGIASFPTTGATGMVVGTTAQRPTPATGYFRFNTSGPRFEGYDGTSWTPLAVTTGGGDDIIFTLNEQTVTTNYTVPASTNAMSAGQIVVDLGIQVTVTTGSQWNVV
jgi:hypothetical protein